MLEKKYYDGTQVHRIISEEVKDYDTIMKILKRFADEPSALGTDLAEVGTDCISRQAAIDAVKRLSLGETDATRLAMRIGDYLERLPSAQPERACVNCGRTANNGGWYADGRTRCPIEEHYALPKDGFCHLWEKRNVTDDDYPERRTNG